MKVENLIIGAGPAGLAVAGRLRKLNIPFELVEATNTIAHSWHQHYDRLCLHTVKQLSHLPHLDFPDTYDLYVSRKDLINYYRNYATHFQIQPHFGTTVSQISRLADGDWGIATEKGMTIEAKRVVVATGVNRVPFSPAWPGQEGFGGTIRHSRVYKNPEPFKGGRVLLVGMGNTGAELALDLSEAGVETAVSVRGAVNIVPRDVNGRPTQLTARQLAKLPFGLGDWLGTQIRKLIIGDLSKYGLRNSTLSPAKQLRETGKTPVIDLGTVAQIKKGKIKILPAIDHFEGDEVVFENGEKQVFDHLILATGYRAKLASFLPAIDPFLDQYQIPKGPVADGALKGLYFVGFDNYKLGGLLGTIFHDSETIAEHISNS